MGRSGSVWGHVNRPGALRLAILSLTLVGAAGLAACGGTVAVPSPDAGPTGAREVPGGDARQGRQAVRTYGCGACHVIPGVTGATGLVGPPLNSFARRAYVAGNLPNTPPNLIRWIQTPQAVEPGTAMPNLGVGEADARDIAAYLYTLE
jgi:cytochrome c